MRRPAVARTVPGATVPRGEAAMPQRSPGIRNASGTTPATLAATATAGGGRPGAGGGRAGEGMARMVITAIAYLQNFRSRAPGHRERPGHPAAAIRHFSVA